MIRLFHASEAGQHADLYDGMLRLRAEVFHERMQWPVTVHEGRERDTFDDLNPLYVLVTDGDGMLQGSARLLPTTGPTMLGDVFSDLLPDGLTISAPTIWESSRFAVTNSNPAAYARQLNPATGELLAGLIETGIRAGLEYIVTVMDVSVERVLKRAGCPCERLGTPHRIGKSLAVVGLFEMKHELLQQVRDASGIDARLLKPDLERLGLAA